MSIRYNVAYQQLVPLSARKPPSGEQKVYKACPAGLSTRRSAISYWT